MCVRGSSTAICMYMHMFQEARDTVNEKISLSQCTCYLWCPNYLCTELKGTEQIKAAFDKFFSSTKVSTGISIHYITLLNPLLLLIPGEWKEARGQV